MAGGTPPIYGICSGCERHRAVSAIKSWVYCPILIFLHWMHGWLREEWGVQSHPTSRRVTSAWGGSMGGGQGAGCWAGRSVEQCHNKPHVCLPRAEADRGVRWDLYLGQAQVCPWRKEAVAVGLCCPVLKAESGVRGLCTWRQSITSRCEAAAGRAAQGQAQRSIFQMQPSDACSGFGAGLLTYERRGLVGGSSLAQALAADGFPPERHCTGLCAPRLLGRQLEPALGSVAGGWGAPRDLHSWGCLRGSSPGVAPETSNPWGT